MHLLPLTIFCTFIVLQPLVQYRVHKRYISPKMETLPTEIIELILTACEAKTLAISIPRVSKLYKKLSGDDSNIWKAKCEQKRLDLNGKHSDRTWKQYYFTEQLKLFPFFGFTITKTTHKELLAAPDAKPGVSGSTEYVEINEHNFWIDNGKFDMLYLTYTDILPADWVAQGITWSIPFTELKALLKKKIGNYHVTTAPHQGTFQDRDCFTAEINSVVKEGEGAEAFYYRMSFNYNYKTGTETSPNTLYSITILAYYDNGSSVDHLSIYQDRECLDK